MDKLSSELNGTNKKYNPSAPNEIRNIFPVPGLFGNSTNIEDIQYSNNINIRGNRKRWVVNWTPLGLVDGDIWYDDLTWHTLFYNARNNTIYNNVIYSISSGAIAAANATDQVITFSAYDNNDVWLETNPGFITVTEKGMYYLYWYARFDTWTGDRRIAIKNNAVEIAFNTVPGIPAQSVPVSWWGWGTVNIPSPSLELSVSVTWLEYLQPNDILSLHVEQDSWGPLNTVGYLLMHKL